MKIFAIAALAALIAAPAMAAEHAAHVETHTTTAPVAVTTTTTTTAEATYVTTADSDKSGSVSWDEAKAATDSKFGSEGAFKAADTNADGSLSAEEVNAVK